MSIDAFRAARTILPCLLMGSLAACEDPGSVNEESGCQGGKCDDASGVVAELEDFDDPIAAWLRDNVDENGALTVGYLDMLRGISELQGCPESDIDSYVISDALVVSGSEAFPRVVNTVCSTNRQKADLAFFALSFPNADQSDIDTRNIEMFAWDDTTKEYRFYKTTPERDAAVLEVAPAECQGCHLTAEGMDDHGMPMTPIMNELAAPWQHWHAEPVSFDHVVPDEIEDAPAYAEIAGKGSAFRKSAARLEQTIRSAFNQRVAISRAGLRRVKPADVDDAMGALRPLFCDEQLTYATEDGSSGLLAASVVIDDGWHSVFFVTMGVGWTWEWWNDRQLRLTLQSGTEPLDMIPTRGASVVAYEKQLLTLRALTPDQVARVRALDWHTPVMSDFRCELWENALPRVKANLPIELTDDTRNLHLMRALFDEIFVLHPGDFGLALTEPLPLQADQDQEGRFIALASADDASLTDLTDALAEDRLAELACDAETGAGTCAVTLQEMGDLLEARFKSVETEGREELRAVRDERGCLARDRYRAVPHIGGLSCQ